MKKINIVSYRCPTVYGAGSSELSTGGLVASLYSMKSQYSILWFCFDSISSNETHGNITIQRVKIEKELNDRFYGKFCNTYIWPLFHYGSNVEAFDNTNWQAYVEANIIMSKVIVENLPKEERILVNDYHLALLPKFLREMGYNRISFFWHIPWINYEYISRLPNLRDLVSGILNASIIGFHNQKYKQNFEDTAKKLGFDIEGRKEEIISVPIGLNVDLYKFDLDKIRESKFDHELRKMKRRGIKIIGSISRLDTTKGIIQSVLAFRNMLEKHRDLIEKVVYVMVISPSRTSVPEYAELKRKIDQIVGNVNSNYRTVSWSPILYIYRKISHNELISLMRNSTLFLIAPIMDGLNLVAEEYVLINRNGIPIISRFAGISEYLSECPIVNPFDPDETSRALFQMLNEDRKFIVNINKKLRQRVKELDINNWARLMIPD